MMAANEFKLVNGTLFIYDLIDFLLQCDNAFLFTTWKVVGAFLHTSIYMPPGEYPASN